jgi:hypothetical protein
MTAPLLRALHLVWLLCAFALSTSLSTSANAQEKSERAYVFGNSLVHHLTDSDETTVPHWLALMAREAGHDFALSGQWGFVRDFRANLPPVPNWSFRNVTQSWDSERRGFGSAGLTSVWINPANFIQYQTPDAPYDGDNPENLSPVQATTDVLAWATTNAPDVGVYVYEGWPEMASITGRFPPSERALAEYHRFATEEYAQWFDAYVGGIKGNLPDTSVSMIPVSRVLSSVMLETALSALPAETFYSDDAPHGTSALYLMAAMVVYNTVYAEPLPDAFRPPTSIAPELRATFTMVRDAIWERVSDMEDIAAIASAVSQDAPQEMAQVAADDLEDAGAEVAAPMTAMRVEAVASLPQPEQPSLAMGLNGVADWSVQHPFLNLMKTARPWVGHKDDQWGAFSDEDILSGGYLDAQGWPMKLPEGARALEAFILTDQPEDAGHLAGRYVLTYEGSGTLDVGGRAQNKRRSDGEISFDYAPGEGLVAISVTDTDPAGTGDYIRNIAIFREDQRVLVEAGVTFNPGWVNRIDSLRSVRFMDWMSTNGSKIATWDERPKRGDFTYVRKGVPLEDMIELANLIGADPWFNMPHMADDAYMKAFAEMVKADLRPDLKAYVEYSNEVWNFIFPQAVYAQEQAKERWGRKAGDDAWMQFYGMRSAQMALIWTEVFGDEASARIIPTIGTHTGWLGLEESSLNAPLWLAEDPANNWEPYIYFGAYAVTGYFGYEMGSDEQAPQVLEWIEQSVAAATRDADVKGLSGADKDAYVETHKYDAANALVYAALKEGSVKELVEVIFPQQAQVAADHGLKLAMYEGGTHVAVSGEWSANEVLIEFFKQFNYSDQMAQIYQDVLTGWKASGGTLFNAFVDVARPSQYGSWGALRHLQDSNPRWDALMAFNADVPAWWEEREVSSFQGGRILTGDAEQNELIGTPQPDVLAGLGGDDILMPVGGNDRLLGGDGFDAALLPGEPSDYSFSKTASGLRVRSDLVDAELESIEMLWFEGDEELAIMVADLI